MDLFVLLKFLSLAAFIISALLSIFSKSRIGYARIAIISIVVNFWICAKLGENPKVALYFVTIILYVIVVIVISILWQNDEMEIKPEQDIPKNE